MIIPVEKLAGQNSAYRHRNMKGAFGNEGALRFTCSKRLRNDSGHAWLEIIFRRAAELFPPMRRQ